MEKWKLYRAILAALPLAGCNSTPAIVDCQDHPGYSDIVTGFSVRSIDQRKLTNASSEHTVIEFDIKSEQRKQRLSSEPLQTLLTNNQDCPHPKAEQKITWINVVSNAGYDELHPSGVSLNSLVRHNFLPQALDQHLREKAIPLSFSKNISFSLAAPPTVEPAHRLTFEFMISSGQLFTVTTDTIHFDSRTVQ